MKSLVMIGLLTSLNSFADVPKVVCSAYFYQTDETGITLSATVVDKENITPSHLPQTISGATLKIETRQLCAPDGGPCMDRYELSATLKINNSESGTTSVISSTTDKSFRQSLNIRVGNDNAFVNCDIQ